ncbi:MAG: SCP2 sterol-binding domain-containing protein [Acidimicrobiales bacterium]|jgi:hypothetical protein|nr:SCP2 sterol-binding domain-containing protein [Acidimicrobiales bacterium]
MRYLSPEWLEAAAGAIADDEALQRLAPDTPFVLQHQVTGEEPVTWHVVFGDGVTLRTGAADRPDVTFRCDPTTARRIHDGEESAQQAFMEGRLTLGGDPDALLAHHDLLSSLTDTLAPLRHGG